MVGTGEQVSVLLTNEIMTNLIKSCCLICIFLTGCSRQQEETAVIKGKFRNCSGEKITLLELNTKSIVRLDSVIPGTSGKFRFVVKPEEPGFYMLQSNLGKIMVLYVERGNILTLTGDYTSFPDMVRLKGPKEAELLEEFFISTRKNERKVDSLEMLLIENQDSSGYYRLTLKIDSSFRQIWESQRKYEKDFIDRNPGSLVSLIVLNYSFGLNTVLSPDEDSLWFRKLDNTLTKRYPENIHVKYHHQRILEFQRERELKKGKKQ